MKRIKTVLFDLDGTLTDPGLGITNSVMYALAKFGITVTDRASLYPFIGPPLAESFQKYFGFSERDAFTAVDVYREYFSSKGLFENEIYPGVEAMLQQLQGRGTKILLATSKPEVYAEKILSHFGIDRYFYVIAGSELNHSRIDKHEVIEYAFTRASIMDRSTAIMVGDRHHDIDGAKRSNLASIGVTYGYGTAEELRQAGADYLVGTVGELTALLTGDAY